MDGDTNSEQLSRRVNEKLRADVPAQVLTYSRSDPIIFAKSAFRCESA